MSATMPNESDGHTRREALRRGVAAATGLVLGASISRIAYAQGTPEALAVDDGYTHPESLIDGAWLKGRMDDPATVVVAFMPLDEAEQARIPGALQVDWPELEVVDTSDASIARWQENIEGLIGDLGISQDSNVVVYDNGTLFAARLWWILSYLGHERVHMLDGGLAAWHEAGYETESGPIVRTLIKHPPYNGTPRADALAQLDEVMTALDNPDAIVVDARTPEEYAEGHIPGAVNVNFPLNALPEPPKLWKPADELRAMYEAEGVTPDRLVIPYCSSGVRSAVTAFTLHLIGYDAVSLYTGSWQEWGEHPDTPVSEGEQP